jgi:hypothetical protein
VEEPTLAQGREREKMTMIVQDGTSGGTRTSRTCRLDLEERDEVRRPKAQQRPQRTIPFDGNQSRVSREPVEA